MSTHDLQDEPESTLGSRPMHPEAQEQHAEAPAVPRAHDLQEEPESTLGSRPMHPHEPHAEPAEPEGEEKLRWWLRGVRLPATRGEVVDQAERNGAPAAAVGFLESLPSAVFTSEKGLEHVLMLLRDEDLPDVSPDAPPASEDGEAS